MYSALELGFNYLKYLISAENGKGHGVHSPFVFDFIIHVLNNKKKYYAYQEIEALRQLLKTDGRKVSITDLGAGSRKRKGNITTVSQIAKTSLKPKKYSQLLFRIADYYRPKTILELGTSLGLTTAYLASANEKSKVITLEGIEGISAIAKENFDRLQLKNVEVVEGNFDNTLPAVVERMASIDLAFLDGNHQKLPTLNYFNLILPKTNDNSLLIFDDIHWSREMEEAWEAIKDHPQVTLTIDLFFIGLVFFRKQQKVKQHFTIRF